MTSPRRRRNTPKITFHFGNLPEDEITTENGIPVTSPGRVVLDLAAYASLPTLHRMLEAGEQLRPWHGPSIPELLDRYPRRAGTPKLRTILATPLAMTRSELEAQFLYLIDEWGLPRPQMNLTILGFEADCVWPERKVIVELDVFETHGSSFAFERDRRRDRVLKAAKWEVIRVTPGQLAREAAAVRADLTEIVLAG